MPSREISLIIDTNSRKLVSSFTSTATGSLPSLVIGDSTLVSARFVTPTGITGAPWEEVDLTDQTVRIGIGIPGAKPTSGTYTISYNGDTTTALDFHSSASALSDALNALASITSAGGVTVTSGTSGAMRIVFVSAGAREPFTLTTDSLSPTTDAFVSVIKAGSASVNEVVLISLEASVAAYAELTDELPTAAVVCDTVRDGDVGVSDIQSLSLSPIPYGGSYTLTIGGEETTSLAFDSESSAIKTAIEALPSIGSGNVNVTGTFPDFTISFDPSLGDVSEATGNASALIVPTGKKGLLSTNTGEIKDLLGGKTSIDAVFEVQLYDISNSTTDTVLQEGVSIREDVIPNSPSAVAGGPTYITSLTAESITTTLGYTPADEDALDAETAARQAADSGLATAIAAETAAREALADGGSALSDAQEWRKNLRAAPNFRPTCPNTLARINYDVSQNYAYRLLQLVSGDSYAVNLQSQLNAMVAKNTGQGGLIGTNYFGGSGSVGAVYGDFTYSPTGGYIPLGPGGFTQFGGNFGVDGFNGSTLHIFYSTVNGGGSFRVEQKIGSGGSWTNLTTGQATAASPISTDNGSTRSAGVLTVNWGATATDNRYIRIIGVSGTSSIIGAHWSAYAGLNKKQGGTETFRIDRGGSHVGQQVACPQSIFDVIIGTLKPHFATWKADDSAAQITADLPVWMDKIESAMGSDNIDWVMVSSHPINAAQNNDLSEADLALQSLSQDRGICFVDIRGSFPPYAQYKSPIDFASDNYHLSAGISHQNQLVMRKISDSIFPFSNTGNSRDFTVQHAPWAWDAHRIIFDNTAPTSGVFEVLGDYNQTGNYRPVFGTWVSSGGEVSRTFGNNTYIFETYKGGFIDFGGFAGAGKGDLAYAVTRNAAAVREVCISNPAPAGKTGHSVVAHTGYTGKAYELRLGGSLTSTGTRKWALDGATGKTESLGGTADAITGDFTLVAGVATISTTAAATNDHVSVTVNNPGGTMGTHYKVTTVNGTSLTITAIDTSGATVTTDTSAGTWAITTGRF